MPGGMLNKQMNYLFGLVQEAPEKQVHWKAKNWSFNHDYDLSVAGGIYYTVD